MNNMIGICVKENVCVVEKHSANNMIGEEISALVVANSVKKNV
jgi:hypothetical protein